MRLMHRCWLGTTQLRGYCPLRPGVRVLLVLHVVLVRLVEPPNLHGLPPRHVDVVLDVTRRHPL
jgi:hypothetical protein